MEILKFALMLVQIISGLLIIGLVLLQHGKGADAGAGFGGGSGGSSSVFGAAGSANFLSRFTALAAIIFFASTLAINKFSNHKPSSTLLQKLSSKPIQQQTAASKNKTEVVLPPISSSVTKNAPTNQANTSSTQVQEVTSSALVLTPPNFAKSTSAVVPAEQTPNPNAASNLSQ
jgi:preprotein translocase subunit SecG